VASLTLVAAACGSSGSKSSSGTSGASSSTTKSASGTSGSASTTTSTTTIENTGKCKSGATKLTMWAWVPGISRAVTAFNATHPTICVTLDDVGAGSPEYVKLADAIKAGSGVPDVAEVEYDELPSFEITKSLDNLASYGADKYKSDFASWAWQEVSQGSDVWAMPGDSGPMALYYNTKELSKYGITPPTTWAEFATDAAKLHKADPSAYMTNFSATDLQWILSLMSQYGASPFAYSGGSDVTIDWTGAKQMAFANYWEKLLKAHDVNSTSDVDATSFADMDKGIDATWVSSAWGPSYFLPDAKASLGDWRASAMPQWSAGADVAANWGGSSYPVFKASAHPAQAAEFTEWLNGTTPSWNILKTAPSSLFPTYLPLLNNPTFKDLHTALTGTTNPNVAFTAAGADAKAVSWPPFMTEALTVATTAFAGVQNGTETLPAAFQSFQKTLVGYAQQQGFHVTQ
jgi:multiple sugar transport system substrate-binding protein